MKPYNYPTAPEQVSEDVIKPSLKFSLQVKKVITLLIVFAFVYLGLVCLTFGLTALLGYLGIQLITHVFNIMAIIVGLGIIGIGVMAFVFVIKFLFAQKKESNTNRVEITEEEYPALFDFVRRISEETSTKFPKHIYLSSEVNAAVFFDSSFWSMILPVRKNLVIGLGLINMINISEFKSIIAHEFGHFSQKSMRTGSYVYHAHKVLYNMLYENNEYSSALNSWASIHSIFNFCARVTIKIVQSIQWVLQQMFKVVNKQYMSLSREMEFHADAMSAKVAGSNNAIHALRRIEFADSCYNTVIRYYNQWLPERYKGENVYQHQLITASYIAQSNRIKVADTGLPLLHDMDTRFKSYTKINVEDQWASHPSRAQREAALNKLNIEGKVVEDSAWVLFDNREHLQTLFTHQLYQDVKFEKGSIPLPDHEFKQKYEADAIIYAYPEYYDGFYDSRYIRNFDIVNTNKTWDKTDASFFNNNKDLFKKLEAAKTDKVMLEDIAEPKSKIRSFDYDSNRYKRKDISDIRKKIEQQIEDLEAELKQKDEMVYRYFHHKAGEKGVTESEALTNMYQQYFRLNEMINETMNYLNTMPPLINPFYNISTLEQAKALSNDLQQETEILNTKVEVLLVSIKDIKGLESIPVPDTLVEFKNRNWLFVNAQQQISGENIEAIWSYLQSIQAWLNDANFTMQKKILEYQIQFTQG